MAKNYPVDRTEVPFALADGSTLTVTAYAYEVDGVYYATADYVIWRSESDWDIKRGAKRYDSMVDAIGAVAAKFGA